MLLQPTALLSLFLHLLVTDCHAFRYTLEYDTNIGCKVRPSQFWGSYGENYSASVLPDFSYAGYRQGDIELPSLKGNTFPKDGTELVQALMTSKDGTVIQLEPTTYTITDIVNITTAVSVKGSGIGKTVLYFPYSLADITNRDDFWFSFGPGLLTFGKGGELVGSKVGDLVGNPAKGSTWIKVNGGKVLPGQTIVLAAVESPGVINATFGPNPGKTDCLYGHQSPYVFKFISKVKRTKGSRVQLERPLAIDITFNDVGVYNWDGGMKNFGIEDLTVKMKGMPYLGHHDEGGYNGIYFSGVSNAWVKNVEILNADTAFGMFDTHFTTLENVIVRNDFDRGDPTGFKNGHHGILIQEMSSSNLVKNFEMGTPYWHDLHIEGYASLNVFANGTGKNINFDHHRYAPYANLFTDIDVGEATRVFSSGGKKCWGKHGGVGNVYWGIPKATVYEIIIGEQARFPYNDSDGFGYGMIFSRCYTPTNLYEAQLARRRGLQSAVSDFSGK